MYSFTSLSHNSSSAALCPNPPALANAMVTFTGNSANDTATYTCNVGFELIGGPTTTCAAASNGNSAAFPAVPPPMCSREYHIAGYFCGVPIFVIFVVNRRVTKFSTTNFTIGYMCCTKSSRLGAKSTFTIALYNTCVPLTMPWIHRVLCHKPPFML